MASFLPDLGTVLRGLPPTGSEGSPVIGAVADGVPRPRWSVMIPTYNREDLLEQSLRSVLAQDPGLEEMQIEVVDNASPRGDTAALVQRLGGGRIGYYRQPSNRGMVGNWNTCLARSRGRWVQVLHDDDAVLPGFYEACRKRLEAHPEVGILLCRGLWIDAQGRPQKPMPLIAEVREDGLFPGAARRLAEWYLVYAPVPVVPRWAYEELGGFTPCLPLMADTDMWIRIALSYAVSYLPEPLYAYRVHQGSSSTRIFQVAENVEEALRGIELAIRRFPVSSRSEVRRAAYSKLALQCARNSTVLRESGSPAIALLHSRWAFRLEPTLRSLLRIVKTGLEAVAPFRRFPPKGEDAP